MVNIININIKTNKGETMILNAIYFALCFMLILLGLIIAIHLNFWLETIVILIIFGFWTWVIFGDDK